METEDPNYEKLYTCNASKMTKIGKVIEILGFLCADPIVWKYFYFQDPFVEMYVKQILGSRSKPSVTVLVRLKKEVSGSDKVVYIDKTDFSNPDHSKKYLYPW